MKNFIVLLCFLLINIPFCRLYAQEDGVCGNYVQKKILHVKNQMIYSLCDSLVSYSQSCLPSSAWYKLKFSNPKNDNTVINVWCVLVQFLDSSYYCSNKKWLKSSEFSISPYSIGVFFYNGLRFEVMANTSFPIEQYITKTDSIVHICMWDANANTIMMPIRKFDFPEYYHILGTIHLSKDEITFSQETCSCKRDKLKQKKCNKRQ